MGQFERVQGTSPNSGIVVVRAMNKRLRILITDDQKLFAESLRKVLLDYPDTVGEVDIAIDGTEAIRKMVQLQPDVVLLDVHMPRMSGLETIRRLRSQSPTAKVIMLTAFGYSDYIGEAVHEGAAGYVLKDVSPTELLQVIHQVTSSTGFVTLSQNLAADAFSKRQPVRDQSSSAVDWMQTLSDRDKQILRLIVRGYSNDEISAHLNLGQQTVKNYISTLYSKLGVSNRFQAMREAIDSGHFLPDQVPL